ncbi:Gfo/Idh/MocA family oxidoreductase [Thalassomonas viridans]|uniref:Gfo/Idh/MocA family oxidoreductase n=2 Tax=Thalassomonas viridans TaxID=137584 RepID=A0AAF0CDJ3_9GAMM|nr:Gfo/Idh/MocA family oxidoreductase [Thalassomonas viridans]
MGMVGGGQGAFIGAIHRIAAQMDNEIELVCGAFSSDPERSLESGKALYLDPARCYGSYQEMFHREKELPADKRMDMVTIVTPNHLHFPVARLALESGFHVMSDKPATLTLKEALELAALVKQSSLLYGLSHTYTGYPMVKEAKSRIAAGALGKIKKVVVEYPQGWLAAKENEQSKQASWRLDPAQSGISCCIGDIGVHAANLAEYITGLEITALSASLTTNVEDRLLDDDGTVLLRFNNNAHGVLLASQISVGEENNLRIRVYGERASLDWSQLEPNSLLMKFPDQASQLIRSGVGELAQATITSLRTPAGHPEGYLEAFANLYRGFAYRLRSRLETDNTGGHLLEETNALDVPGIYEAVRGMAFIENVVAASQSELKWHPFSLVPNEELAIIPQGAKHA